MDRPTVFHLFDREWRDLMRATGILNRTQKNVKDAMHGLHAGSHGPLVACEALSCLLKTIDAASKDFDRAGSCLRRHKKSQ